MSIMTLAKSVEKFAIANSPTLLTAVAVTGSITAAVLAGQASFKAAKLIAQEEDRVRQDLKVKAAKEHIGESGPLVLPKDDEEVLTVQEKTKLVLPLYLPAAGVCVTAVLAMIAANQIGTRRAAAMAAAYSVSEKAFGEYREKIVEKMGIKKEQTAHDEMVQERVSKTPLNQMIVLGDNEVLCFDEHTGRYLKSSMEKLKKAQNDTNYKILRDGYADLNDFYDFADIETLQNGDYLGWKASDHELELIFTSVLSPDDRPCLAFSFLHKPLPSYYNNY